MQYTEIEQKMDKPLKPKVAIVIYANSNFQYVEYAQFDDDCTVGSFKPITQENAKVIYDSLKPMSFRTGSNKMFSGIIKHKLVYVNVNATNYDFAWLKPSHINKYMHVNGDIDTTVKYPNLIFISKGKNFYVYAVKTQNIKDSTMLYHAPIHNMGSGTFCWGTVNSKECYEGDLNKTIDNLEHAFFNSRFSNENSTENAQIFYDCAKKKKSFPINKLKKYKTIGSVLR